MVNPDVKELDSFVALRELLKNRRIEPQSNPLADIFYTLEWLESLYHHGFEAMATALGAKMPKLRLFVAEDGGSNRLVCLALLDGNTLCSLSNYYSSLFGPLVWPLPAEKSSARVATQNAWVALAQQLRCSPRRWPMLTMSPMDAESADFSAIQAALKSQGYQVDTYACFGNWYLQVVGRGFDEYRKTLPSALRRSVERGQRRLTAQSPWNIQIQNADDDQLESAIANFVHVYAKSWKSPEPNLQFVPNLARMAARQGWLRLGVLKIENCAVAAQLWLVKDGKANIFKLAYIEGYERFSVGSVLTHAMMKHCIDLDLVHEVDYLTGDDSYKKDWMSHRRERRGIVAFHLGTARGAWQAGKHFASKYLRL